MKPIAYSSQFRGRASLRGRHEWRRSTNQHAEEVRKMRRRTGFAAVTALVAVTIGLLIQAAPTHATFSGSNGRITFVRFNPDTEEGNIFAADPDGSQEIQLTTGDSGCPDWSPDGTRIAFCFVSSFEPFEVDIGTMNPDGSGVAQLTSGPPFHDFEQPTWSPDATRIAFNSGSGIRTVDAGTGGDEIQVTTSPLVEDRWPSWSPDGERIAFTRVRHSRQREETALFLVRADGTGAHRLTAWGMNADWPDWSPDGTLIAFAGKGTVPSPSSIFTIHPDGAGLTDVVRATGSADFHEPTWSPDGTKLIFQGWLFGATPIPPHPPRVRALWMVNSDGSGLHQIEGVAGDELQQPDWGTYPLATE
jgi:Tol biopolymer transport system component